MAYTSFTSREIKEKFGVVAEIKDSLFAEIPSRKSSDWLTVALKRNVKMALAQSLEKPRSEFIIAPIFSEIYTQAIEAGKPLSLFSGADFNVDEKLGLNGKFDFLLSRSKNQADIEAPIVVAVEAKQDDFRQGLNQCVAEMIAARIFNEREGKPQNRIYGCVTTGDIWRFLFLQDSVASIDEKIYELTEIDQILGILWAMTFDEIK